MRLIESFTFQAIFTDRSHCDRSGPFSATNALRTLLRSQQPGGPDDMNALSVSVLFSRGNHRTNGDRAETSTVSGIHAVAVAFVRIDTTEPTGFPVD